MTAGWRCIDSKISRSRELMRRVHAKDGFEFENAARGRVFAASRIGATLAWDLSGLEPQEAAMAVLYVRTWDDSGMARAWVANTPAAPDQRIPDQAALLNGTWDLKNTQMAAGRVPYVADDGNGLYLNIVTTGLSKESAPEEKMHFDIFGFTYQQRAPS